MPTTMQQAGCLTALAAPDGTLAERVEKAFPSATADERQDIADLLVILGDESSPDPADALRRQFPALSSDHRRERFTELRRAYDWPHLRLALLAAPRETRGASTAFAKPVSLLDLFNLLDLHIQAGSGYRVPGLGGLPVQLSPDSLIAARRALQLLITIQFVLSYRRLLNNPRRLAPYIQFTEALAGLIRKEGHLFANRGHDLQNRLYNLFGYTIVSLNWDPLLLWLAFNAHNRANKDWSVEPVGTPLRPQALFNDLGYLTAIRKVEAGELDVWYAMNESVVHRLNDPSHLGDRYIRFGKFYFPHGSFSFRECPNCGKLNAWLGDEWKVDSPSLLPPLPVPRWSESWAKPRSEKEEKAWREGKADMLQCVYCGAEMRFEHVRLAMQTGFKAAMPPYLDEVQRDLRPALENARHLVFMGYSLPPDDMLYRSILAARLRRGGKPDDELRVSLVNLERGAPDRWLVNDEIDSLPDGCDLRRVYRDLRAIVGDAGAKALHVRAYAGGVPKVFSAKTGAVDEASARDLLFPDDLWLDRRPAKR